MTEDRPPISEPPGDWDNPPPPTDDELEALLADAPQGDNAGLHQTPNVTPVDPGPVPLNQALEQAALAHALLGRPTHIATHPPDTFYVPRHKTIAAAIQTLAAAGHEISPVTVNAHLQEDADGLTELMELTHNTPGPRTIDTIWTQLVELSERRRVIHLADELRIAARSGAPTARHIAQLNTATTPTGLRHIPLGELIRNPPTPPQPDILDIAGGTAPALFYSAKINAVIAPPGVGKSWVALAACAEQIRRQRHVFYLDLEDAPETIAARLAGIGPTADEVDQLFHYFTHDGAWDDSDTAALVTEAEHTNPSVIVIDGGAEAIARADLDENDNGEVTRWFSVLPRPLAATGAAVIILEHDPKNATNAKGWGRGAGAKKAALSGASYYLTADTPLTRTQDGWWSVELAKDRPGGTGHSVGDKVTRIHVRVAEDAGGRVDSIRLKEPDTPAHVTESGASTVVAAVARVIADAPSSRVQGMKNLRLLVRSEGQYRNDSIDQALAILENAGAIETIRQGPGKPNVYATRGTYDPSTGEVQPLLPTPSGGPS